MFDCIIVGGGVAGLSAGLVLARCQRSVLICDTGQHRNEAAREVHGYLTRDGVGPGDLLRAARSDLRVYEHVIYKNMEVRNAGPIAGGFRILFPDGSTESSRKLLLATGVVDEMPNLPNIGQYYGKSVHHGLNCDAWEWRDRSVVAYGKGEDGMNLALELTVWTRDITLCTDGPSFLTDHDRERLFLNRIRLCEEYIVDIEGSEGQLDGVVFANNERLAVCAMFFDSSVRQRSYLPAKLGCEFDDGGLVRTGEFGTTNVAGLYACGDASRSVRSPVIGASDGAKAAVEIHSSLLAENPR